MEAVFFDQLNQLLNDNKLRELRSTLVEMNSADVAEFMADLPEDKLIPVSYTHLKTLDKRECR